MDSPDEKRAKELIRTAVHLEWSRKLRDSVRETAASKNIGWQEACDAVEMSLLTSSEMIKLESERRGESSTEAVGWSLATQAMLDIIVEVRAEER